MCTKTLYTSVQEDIEMNLKKSFLALVAVSAMGVGLVGATNIGLVNVEQVAQANPQIKTYDSQVQAVAAKYNPQIEKAMANVNKQTTDAQKQAVYNQQVLPLRQQEQTEINAIITPLYKDIATKTEQVRVAKKLDIVLSNPNTIVATAKDSQVVDITADVLNLMKK